MDGETEAGSFRREARRGWLAMLPLWAGVVPFGATFAVVAREAGFGPLEVQLCSMAVFAGGAQLALVGLAEAGASAPTVVLTTAVLNLRHVLYGLSLRPALGTDPNSGMNSGTRPPRPVLAFLLTDEAYALTMREVGAGRGIAPFFFGAGLALYVAFAGSTLAGLLLAGSLPAGVVGDLGAVFPLTFAALLAPLLRGRRPVLVAAVAAGLALALAPLVGAGLPTLVAILAGAALGALPPRPRIEP